LIDMKAEVKKCADQSIDKCSVTD